MAAKVKQQDMLYKPCKACGFAWSYSWRQRCLRCSADLAGMVPRVAAPRPPSGAWARQPHLSQPTRSVKPKATAGGGSGQGPRRKTSPLEQLILLEQTLKSGDGELDEDLTKATSLWIAKLRQAKMDRKEPWQVLQHKQHELSRKQKVLAGKLASVENTKEKLVYFKNLLECEEVEVAGLQVEVKALEAELKLLAPAPVAKAASPSAKELLLTGVPNIVLKGPGQDALRKLEEALAELRGLSAKAEDLGGAAATPVPGLDEVDADAAMAKELDGEEEEAPDMDGLMAKMAEAMPGGSPEDYKRLADACAGWKLASSKRRRKQLG